MQPDTIQVVVGVIINEAGEVLLARRPFDVHLGGLWEFPGGKQEPGEDVRTALDRELFEELGLVIVRARPFIQLFYDYPEKSVILNVWLIQEWSGLPYGREGQPVEWCDIRKLSRFEFPPANEKIIKAIQLPSLYLISPGPQGNIDGYLAGIEKCIKAGAKLLQLRCNADIYQNNPELVSRILSICKTHNARLLLNSTPATAVSFKAHGVHLNSVRLLQLNERPLGKSFLVSASCHNQNELQHAERIGVDFVVLSPVESTPSHPDAKPLGWEKFSRMVEISNLPVYALGGMHPEHLNTAWKYGAQGVAMLSGVWSANSPADIIRECTSV